MAEVRAADDLLREDAFNVRRILFKAHVDQVDRRIDHARRSIDRACALGDKLHFIMGELSLRLVFPVRSSIPAENDDGLVQVGRLDFPRHACDPDSDFLQFPQGMDRLDQVIDVKLAGFHGLLVQFRYTAHAFTPASSFVTHSRNAASAISSIFIWMPAPTDSPRRKSRSMYSARPSAARDFLCACSSDRWDAMR